MRRRSSASGNGKSMTKSSRRTNASSMLRRKLVARIDRARVGLHALQQVGDLDVGVAVVGVRDLRALAEQGVGLVEEQDRVGAVGGGEDPLQVLLGLADVLARRSSARSTRNRSSPRSRGDHLRRHRLAGARLAREQDLEPLGPRHGDLVAPLRQHLVAVAQVGRDRAQQVELALGEDEVVPAVGGIQMRGQLAQPRGRGVARAEIQIGGARHVVPRERARRSGSPRRRRGSARSRGGTWPRPRSGRPRR